MSSPELGESKYYFIEEEKLFAGKIIFDDVQWRDYGVSATRDEKEFESKLTTVIPYTSIYEVIILSDEDE